MQALRPVARVLGIVGGAAFFTVIVLWPAIWADPITQLDRVRESVHIGYTHPRSFFRGRITTNGSRGYYLVALPLRMTPWTFGAMLVGVPLAVIRRVTRMRALIMLLAVVPVAYTLSTAELQGDRYGLLILGPLCVVVGLAFMPRSAGSQVKASPARLLILGGGLLATIYSGFVAPWGLAYYNPALGGGKTATKQILVGWNEGGAIASRRIADLERHDCRGVTFSGLDPFMIDTWQCGTWVPDPEKATYLAVYVSRMQRSTDRELRELTKGRVLVSTVTIRDIDYVLIWR
jgi:hypothetical protein